MVYKVLSIITGILLSVVVVLGVVSAVYTLGSTAVREGFGELSASFEGGVDAIKAAIDDLVNTSPLVSGAAEATSGSGAGLSLPDLSGLFGAGSGGQTTASSFADPEQGAAYQTWKDAVAAPVQRVFAGTDVDATMIEGVSGGSRTATDMLTALDDTTLATVSANATNLRATALANVPSSILPSGARQSMNDANESCAEFCDQVGQLVEDVRAFKSGDMLAVGRLYSTAGAAKAALDAMDAAMLQAEQALGVA